LLSYPVRSRPNLSKIRAQPRRPPIILKPCSFRHRVRLRLGLNGAARGRNGLKLMRNSGWHAWEAGLTAEKMQKQRHYCFEGTYEAETPMLPLLLTRRGVGQYEQVRPETSVAPTSPGRERSTRVSAAGEGCAFSGKGIPSPLPLSLPGEGNPRHILPRSRIANARCPWRD
jgi:hypothetical protein